LLLNALGGGRIPTK